MTIRARQTHAKVKETTDPLRLFTDSYTKNVHSTELGSGQTWGTHSQKRRAFLQEPPPRVCRARAMLATAPARSGLSVRKSVDPFADLLRRPVLRQIRSVYQDRLGTSREKGSVCFLQGRTATSVARSTRTTLAARTRAHRCVSRSAAPPRPQSDHDGRAVCRFISGTFLTRIYFRNLSDAYLFPEHVLLCASGSFGWMDLFDGRIGPVQWQRRLLADDRHVDELRVLAGERKRSD